MPAIYFIILIIFFMPSDAEASSHENLQNLSYVTINKSYDISGISVSFHGRYEEDEKLFLSTARNSISVLPLFFPSATSCKNIEIHVYEMPRDILNNRDTMSFLDWSAWNNQDILGTYDSISSRPGTASIFVTRDRGREVLSDTIVHEMVHFWQDSHCMPVIEPPAVAFESYYNRKFN